MEKCNNYMKKIDLSKVRKWEIRYLSNTILM